MKNFHNLVVVGVLLVTLLVIIDTIDAGKKESKKREIGNKNGYDKQKYNSEKSKKTQTNSFQDGDYSEQYREEALPYKTKKTKRETSFSENGSKTKTKKSYQKVKKYKVVEANPSEDFSNRRARKSRDIRGTTTDRATTEDLYDVFDRAAWSTTDTPASSTTGRTTKRNTDTPTSSTTGRTARSTTDTPASSTTASTRATTERSKEDQALDEVVKSLRASFPKRNITAEMLTHFGTTDIKSDSDSMNRMGEGGYIEMEEVNGGTNTKRRKYKLVEVVLEEDQNEGSERNENHEEEEVEYLQPGARRTESEEIIEKIKTSKTTKGPKVKRAVKNASSVPIRNTTEQDEEEVEEVVATEELPDYFSTPEAKRNVCKRFPEDPNREGPTKLILYVVEKVIDGKKVKKVVPVEDGVSLCEVTSLMVDEYGSVNEEDDNE